MTHRQKEDKGVIEAEFRRLDKGRVKDLVSQGGSRWIKVHLKKMLIICAKNGEKGLIIYVT